MKITKITQKETTWERFLRRVNEIIDRERDLINRFYKEYGTPGRPDLDVAQEIQ